MKGYIFLNRRQNIQKLGSEICYKIGRGENRTNEQGYPAIVIETPLKLTETNYYLRPGCKPCFFKYSLLFVGVSSKASNSKNCSPG